MSKNQMQKKVLLKGKDITGKKYHKLTILEPAGYDSHKQRLVRARCDCGTEKIIRLYNITSGATKSCGCLNYEKHLGNYSFHRMPEMSPPGKVIWGGRNIAKLQFGNLVILKETEPRQSVNGAYRRRVLCRCSCGKLCEKDIQSVIYGTTKSCGHLRADMIRSASQTHGMSGTKLYRTWIRIRSLSKKGALEVYPEWEDASTGFEAFRQWAMHNGYNEAARLTRKDRKKSMNPDNCYWKMRKCKT